MVSHKILRDLGVTDKIK